MMALTPYSLVPDETRRRFDRRVGSRLRGLGRAVRAYLLIHGLARVSAAALSLVLFTLFVDWAFQLGWDMRLAQLLTCIAGWGGLACRWLGPAVRLKLPDATLAGLVERAHPQLASRLVTAVEMAAAGNGRLARSASSPALAEALVAQAEQASAPLSFRKGLDHRRVRTNLALAISCVATLVVMFLLAGPTMHVWFERNVLLRHVDWPRVNRLVVEGLTDGRMIAPRGEDVTVIARVDAGFQPPRQVFVDYEDDAGGRGREQMAARRIARTATVPANEQATSADPADVRFGYTFERPTRSMRCRIHGGDATTEWFRIELVDRPRLKDLTLGITPPGYTGLAPYTLRAGQTVAEVLPGSEVSFNARMNHAVTDVRLVRTVGAQAEDVIPVERHEDRTSVATDRPETSATYHYVMTDARGLGNISATVKPVRLSVRLLEDQPPKVKLHVQGVGEMVTAEARLPLAIDLADTYGLASASIAVTVVQLDAPDHDEPVPVLEPIENIEPGTKTLRRTIEWVPGRRGFIEGDRISIRAEARDFDDVRGPNVGRCAPVTLRIVSREELLAELHRREQEYRQDFERLVRQQEELYGELLSVASGGADGPAEAVRDKVRQLARRQRDFRGRIHALGMQFEQVLSEWRINQLATPAVEERLGWRIVEPIDELHRGAMPAAADQLDTLARLPADRNGRAARAAQERVLDAMREILASMLKWEGFQEAVTLLRDIQRLQRTIHQETQERIEEEIFGAEP